METKEVLKMILEADVKDHINNSFGYYYAEKFPDGFVDEVIEDVMISSGYSEGHWNDDDIRMSTSRIVLKHIGIEV